MLQDKRDSNRKRVWRFCKEQSQGLSTNSTKDKKLPPKKQLIAVNTYLNQLLPGYDIVTKKQLDYWQTPLEFLLSGKGDCEDYVSIKYFTLTYLGFSKEKLFFSVVRDRYSKQLHMVLSYFQEKNQPPLILDNLSFRILYADQRSDLEFLRFINTTGVYVLVDGYHLKKVASKEKKFDALLQRTLKEHFFFCLKDI